ncbi:MAG: Bug family tripartite tricarboxylate transporter substrate binding protein [Burkholderiaceae bacterium]
MFKSLLFLFLGLGFSFAHAQYPDKTIRLIVPFPAGGGADAVARLVAERLSVRLEQTVMVDNRAGAGGSIGALAVANAPSDGYTLLINNNGHAIVPNLQSVTWDPVKDFVAISQVSVLPMIIFTNAKSPITSVDQLIAWARSSNKILTYGSSGIGGPLHLGMELFAKRADIKLLHVPYKGNAPMVAALLGGEIDLTMDTRAISYPLTQQGKLRALAVSSSKRLKSTPELPTLIELGLTGFTYEGWQGIFAPKNTPSTVVAKLNKELNSMIENPDVRKKLEDLGNEPHPSTQKEFSDLVQSEFIRYRKIITENQIKGE